MFFVFKCRGLKKKKKTWKNEVEDLSLNRQLPLRFFSLLFTLQNKLSKHFETIEPKISIKRTIRYKVSSVLLPPTLQLPKSTDFDSYYRLFFLFPYFPRQIRSRSQFATTISNFSMIRTFGKFWKKKKPTNFLIPNNLIIFQLTNSSKVFLDKIR